MQGTPDYSILIQNVSRHIKPDDDEIRLLVSKLKFKSLKKRQTIQLAGEPCRLFSFVNSGILRAYFTGSDGKEHTIMFATKDWWITDMHCFVNGLPAMVSIEALDESEVLSIDKSQLDNLYEAAPKFERYFRILLQNAYTREQLRTIQNLSLPAEDRYRSFVSKYPNLLPLITQKQLASYLGITPEFLSVIRAKKA